MGGPGSNPRFNVQVGRLVDAALGNTGCEVCHAPRAAHPRVLQIPAIFGPLTTLTPLNTPWYLHCKASPSGFAACNRCHGANLDGVGAVAGATACTFCHRSGLPTTLLNCTSCHSSPPSGSVYPNIASAHPRHSALNVADICGECHHGLGSVTLDHFLRARNNTSSVQTGAVQFGAFAQTGGVSPLFNETTQQCSSTYCHGATLVGGTNKSPRWNDAAYLAAAGCGTCHGVASGSVLTAGRPNGTVFPNIAGRHASPHSSFACALCHGTNGTGSANHGSSNRIAHGDADVNIQFTGEAAAMTFIRNVPGNGRGTCSGNCHGQNHGGENW